MARTYSESDMNRLEEARDSAQREADSLQKKVESLEAQVRFQETTLQEMSGKLDEKFQLPPEVIQAATEMQAAAKELVEFITLDTGSEYLQLISEMTRGVGEVGSTLFDAFTHGNPRYFNKAWLQAQGVAYIATLLARKIKTNTPEEVQDPCDEGQCQHAGSEAALGEEVTFDDVVQEVDPETHKPIKPD